MVKTVKIVADDLVEALAAEVVVTVVNTAIDSVDVTMATMEIKDNDFEVASLVGVEVVSIIIAPVEEETVIAAEVAAICFTTETNRKLILD